MEKRYAPYPKWFGSAFRKLDCAPALAPSLWRTQQAETWPQREQALCEAYIVLAKMHNALVLTDPLPEDVGSFHGRLFQVIDAEAFSAALVAQISDPKVRRIADKGLIGGIDQFSDSTDLRSHMAWRAGVKGLYNSFL